VLTKEFGGEFAAKQFVDLERYEVFARLRENGRSRVPFRGQTLSSIPYSKGDKEKLLARSREKYATPRNHVDAKLRRWITHKL
jgi:hypothetical protein